MDFVVVECCSLDAFSKTNRGAACAWCGGYSTSVNPDTLSCKERLNCKNQSVFLLYYLFRTLFIEMSVWHSVCTRYRTCYRRSALSKSGNYNGNMWLAVSFGACVLYATFIRSLTNIRLITSTANFESNFRYQNLLSLSPSISVSFALSPNACSACIWVLWMKLERKEKNWWQEKPLQHDSFRLHVSKTRELHRIYVKPNWFGIRARFNTNYLICIRMNSFE